MKLGEFLSQKNTDRELAPFKPVSFAVVGEDRQDGSRVVNRKANAVLIFVDETKRAEALRAAKRELRQFQPDGALDPVELSNEEIYQILALALRDAENHRQPLANSVGELRAALVKPVARQLSDEYEAFLKDEFPSHVTTDEFEELAREAEKK
jgi:hypothetical protein